MNHYNSHERSDLGASESSLSEATSITGGGGFTIRVKGVTLSFTIAIFFVHRILWDMINNPEQTLDAFVTGVKATAIIP